MWTEGAWGVNASAEGANGTTHGVSVGIDGPGGVRPMRMQTSCVNSR